MSKDKEKTKKEQKLYCGVISVADSDGHQNDITGGSIIDSLAKAGHNPLYYKIVRDDKEAIKAELETALKQEGLSAIIINGGTGINENEFAMEAVTPLFEKYLPGFGELFRMLSYNDVGSSAMTTGAAAGISAGKVVFLLPGEQTSVKIAMEKLIVPELGNVVKELRISRDRRDKEKEEDNKS